MHTRAQRGITIVEVIVGVAIMALIVAFISYTITLFVQSSNEALKRTQALYLAEEGIETMRYLRDSDWNTLDTELANDTTYYLHVATTTLATTTTPERIDDTYTRSFELTEVWRDGDDDIVDAGGSIDDGSRYVTFSVSWDTATVSMTTLLTNIHDI